MTVQTHPARPQSAQAQPVQAQPAQTQPTQARPTQARPVPALAAHRHPAGPFAVPGAAHDLVAVSRRGLLEATLALRPEERYVHAHLAALRAAAAVLAARARPADGRRRRPRSVWALLPDVAPELSEWATFFAAGAGKRAAAEAGLDRVVTAREADDLLRDAESFLGLVETTLGLARSTAPMRTGSTRTGTTRTGSTRTGTTRTKMGA